MDGTLGAAVTAHPQRRQVTVSAGTVSVDGAVVVTSAARTLHIAQEPRALAIPGAKTRS